MALSFLDVFCIGETVKFFVIFTLDQVSDWLAGEANIFLRLKSVMLMYAN